MADKTTGDLQAVAVGDLPLAPDIYDDTLIPVEQSGEAKHMTGAQWKAYGVAAAKEEADRAAEASTHQPIIQNGTWWTWNLETDQYVDTGTSAQGDPGDTPVKGTDYWTEADKQEIVDEVTEQVAPVSYNAQTLTDEQKAQARENIGTAADTVRIEGTSMEEKCTEFAALFNDTKDIESFLFFTDQHLISTGCITESFYTALRTLKDYYEATPTNFCLSGGDWLNNGDTQDEACFELGYIDGYMRKNFRNYYPILGNHDTNYQGVGADGTVNSGILTDETIRNLWFRENGETYYSFDGSTTKFYVLNSGTDWDNTLTASRADQITWLANSLLTDDHLHSAIAVHIAVNSDTQTLFMGYIASVIAAYNGRTTFSFGGQSYDYGACSGALEFVISGHAHYDAVSELGGVPLIVTTNFMDGDVPTFDLVLVDYEARKVELVRVGTGENRTVALVEEDTPVTYTNLLDTALAFDSDAVYCDVGYKDETALATNSGMPSDRTGCVATGLIPYVVNSAEALNKPLYIKAPNAEVFSDELISGNYWCRMILYDRAKAFKHTLFFQALESALWTATELATGYYKIEWKPNPAGTNTYFAYSGYSSAYIAFTFIGSGDGLIITENEPIE